MQFRISYVKDGAMKRLLLFLILVVLYTCKMLAGGKGAGDQVQRLSAGPSYPQPFAVDQDWSRDKPAISTGYYVVDSDSEVGAQWRPDPKALFVDTTEEPDSWQRIVSGPRQFPLSHWDSFAEGHMYFRNPGDSNDSTDNAFAGPIRIGFPFYFNGVRYDSFYVSTNMLIALSNRRYFYENGNGKRRLAGDKAEAWDPQSDDTRERLDPFNEKGLRDPVADDWGYRFVACGGDPDNPLLGIRNPRNTALEDFSNNAPIIAPAWDDWQLSQYNEQEKKKEDHGQVWYRRYADNTKLTIYFLRIQPIGSKDNPLNPAESLLFKENNRVGEDILSYQMHAQVTLNAADSSVSFLYSLFRPALLSVNNRPVTPGAFVKQNATIGLRGQARYRDKENKEQRYTQYTEYLRDGQVFVGSTGREAAAPHNDLALQFKQYKNTLRLVDVHYLVRDPENAEFTIEVKDIDNFEYWVLHRLLGAIKPVALFQNLSNDIQGIGGVNYRQQDLGFQAQFRIENKFVDVNKVTYGRKVCVDSFALAHPNSSGVRLVDIDRNPLPFDGNGVPPYGFVEVEFPSYERATPTPEQFGRLTATCSVSPTSCRDEEAPEDDWPFDDSLNFRLYGVGLLQSFEDFGTDFSSSAREGMLPSLNKWVSLGASVVDGDDNTYNPPPPRGATKAVNDENVILNSPVIRLDRRDEQGRDLTPGGDELRSFPIDLRGVESAVLSFSYQRAGRPLSGDRPRGWSDEVLQGPEPRVLRNGDPLTSMQNPDQLEVHFKNPSPDNYSNIVNVADEGWTKHPRLDKPGEFFNDNPAWTIFGGGGHRRGFSRENPDSALARSEGLTADLFDDGKDWEFSKVYVPIPAYLLEGPVEAARTFRFKLSLRALNNHQKSAPVDDDDPFFIDNIQLLKPTETPDLEIELVRGIWPYTMAPASQAQKIPLEVKLSNNSIIPSRAFAVQILIREEGEKDESLLLYCRAQTLPFLRAMTETRVPFPTWNGRETRPGRYVLSARMNIPGGDPQPLNDSSFGHFDLIFGNAFAYDPPTAQGLNNVPGFAGFAGKGLNLTGFSSGESGGNIPYGPDGGNASGQIAMKFTTTVRDTLRGYQAYFGGLSSERIEISFALYQDIDNRPGSLVGGSRIFKQRGIYDFDAQGKPWIPGADPKFDEYAIYSLPNNVILDPGTYWMSVIQLGSQGIELGASGTRMGLVTTNYSDSPTLGSSGSSILIDKQLREFNREGERVNSSVFAYEDAFAGRRWHSFTPTVGNPAYAHLNHAGRVGAYNSYSRGSWIPLIRPHFGHRTYSDPPVYAGGYGCEAPGVELARFTGAALPPLGIELYWGTASETNNAGFYVERRRADSQDEFLELGFVKGAGTSTVPLSYDFLDEEVERGALYEYRLRQVDYDGSLEYSRAITLRYDFADELRLSNSPNPFRSSTDFIFTVPAKVKVKLMIVDLMGRPVRTLYDAQMLPADEQRIGWDGRNNAGQVVAPGIYIGRLLLGEQTISTRVNYVK